MWLFVMLQNKQIVFACNHKWLNTVCVYIQPSKGAIQLSQDHIWNFLDSPLPPVIKYDHLGSLSPQVDPEIL